MHIFNYSGCRITRTTLGILVSLKIKYLFPLITSTISVGVYLFLTNCGTHEKTLNLTISGNGVFPVQVSKKDGTKFTGKVYGTFFRDKTFDCLEWEGRYLNGYPEGEFKLYSNCNVLNSVWHFNNGKFIKHT